MPVTRPPAFPPELLRATADLRRLGEDPDDRHDDGRARWVRVRRGVVAPARAWERSTPEQRHAALVHATAMQLTGDEAPPFSHAAAAALWRLPRVNAWPTRVDVSSTAGCVRSSGLVRRHRADVPDVDVVDGQPVTSLVRTLIDLARTETLPDAVAAADHALHHRLCTRAELEQELARVPTGARGIAAARLVVAFAEPGAMSVGESLSRVQMFRLNLPRPQLQVEVRDAAGLVGFCDFGWRDVMGEFDGRSKYTVHPGMSPQEAAEVVWREKRREDRIRATGRRMARWVWAEVVQPRRMLAALAAQGVTPTPRSTWFRDV